MDFSSYRCSQLTANLSCSTPQHHGQFQLHTHTRAELYCLVSGSAVFYIEGSEYRLSPGDILLMRPAEAHFVQPDPDSAYERIVLSFDMDILSALDPENLLMKPYFDRPAGKRNLYPGKAFPDSIHLTYLYNILTDTPGRHLVVLANLILLLQQINLQFGKTDPSADLQDTLEYRIIRYINNHLEQDLTIPELCERFYISRAQLCRRFKNATGTSVGKFICAKRLIYARQMLLMGQKPTDIFTVCGFQDYSTFYRAYSRYFGHSPSAVQERSQLITSDEDIDCQNISFR